jgi:hypothetical protein
LTPASRRQNHTTSPSAFARFVKRAISVHRIPPHVDDVRNAPLSGRDGARYGFDLGLARRKIFLQVGLDSKFASKPVGQITRSSHGRGTSTRLRFIFQPPNHTSCKIFESQDRPLKLYGQSFDAGQVHGRLDACEIQPISSADISVQHLAYMACQTEAHALQALFFGPADP